MHRYLITASAMLETILPEVRVKIFAFVDNSDLLNLRLASRRLHQETWQAFGSAFFSLVYFDFCIGSFQNLQKIAQHNDLRHFVQELRVGDQWACNNDSCRAMRSGHRLGQGYKWTREASGCIDVDASEMITSFRQVLAERLSNCRAFCMRQGGHERPGEKGSDALISMTDAVYLLLFVVSGLPIRSLRFEFIPDIGLQPQELPRQVIDDCAITPRWADTLTELRLDWDFFPDQLDIVHIATSIITRAKALRRLHLDLQGFDEASANPVISRLLETSEVAPLTHLVLRRFRVQERQLSAFLHGFKNTLRYLHMSSITLDSGEWATVLSKSRRSLSSLEHFTLCDANFMDLKGLSPLFFGYTLEWTGIPISGTAEFVVKAIRTSPRVWTFRVHGIYYQGPCNVMQEFLIGLETCVRLSSPSQDNEPASAVGWTREDLPMSLVLAGRVKAERFKAKRFNSIFDRPSDRSPLHDWPSST